MLDWWSLAHLASGLALGLFIPWWAALGLILGYEVVEAGLRRIKRGGEGIFEYESWANIAGDVVVGFVGWGLGRWLSTVPPLA